LRPVRESRSSKSQARATSASDTDEPRQESSPPSRRQVTVNRRALADAVNGVVVSPVVRRILADGGVEPSTISAAVREARLPDATPSAPSLTVRPKRWRRTLHVVAVWDNTWPSQPRSLRTARCHRADGASSPSSTRSVVRLAMVSPSRRDARESAAVRALAEFEFLNATFAGEQLVVHRTVNLGLVRSVADDGCWYRSSTRPRG